MTTVHGLPACTCLARWIPAFEAAIGRSPRWFQLIGDAPASAGFHRGGGSADCELLSDSELRIARNMGAAAFNRLWEGNYHAHLRLNGCKHNTIAQPQVADLNAGRDGTGPLYDNAGVPDNGPRDGVHWPLRTWREGIAWGKQQEDDMPLSNEDVDKVVAAVMTHKPEGSALSIETLIQQAANGPGLIRKLARRLGFDLNKKD